MAQTALALGVTEYLPGKDIASEWETLAPEGVDAPWGLAEDGAIEQPASVGDRARGTGTLLVAHAVPEHEVLAVRLRCRPGSTYYTGLIFDFVDSQNWSLLFVDQKSRFYDGHEIGVADTRNGRVRLVWSSTHRGPAAPIVEMAAIAAGRDLLVRVNGVDLFTVPERSIRAGTRVGLYSQKNTDAQFDGLSALRDAPLGGLEAVELEEPPEAGGVGAADVAAPEAPVAPSATYFRVQPPAARSSVDFQEVYTVPLDTFYSSLLMNSSLDSSAPEPGFPRSSVQVLDYRPRRWYPVIRHVKSVLDFSIQDFRLVEAKLAKATGATAQVTAGEAEWTEELAGDLRTSRRDYLVAAGVRHQREEAWAQLLAEVRGSGYHCVLEADVPEDVRKHGFDFYLERQHREPVDFEPVHVPDGTSFGDDAEWARLCDELRTKLVTDGAIPEAAAARFEAGVTRHQALETHGALRREKRELEREIRGLESGIAKKTSAVNRRRAAIAAWQQARERLIAERSRYHRPRVEGYDARAEHQRFQQWLEAQPLRSGERPSWAPWDRHPSLSRDATARTLGPLVFYYWHGWGFARSIAQAGIYYWEGKHQFYQQAIFVRLSVSVSGHPNIRWFFGAGLAVADRMIAQRERTIRELEAQMREARKKLRAHQAALTDLLDHGLARRRESFFAYWNDPERNGAGAVITTTVLPGDDPFALFLSQVSDGQAAPPRVHVFSQTPDGYHDEDGLSLRGLVSRDPTASDDVVAVLPALLDDGSESEELLTAVLNPQPSRLAQGLPVIRFVETYTVDVHWKGFGLGELSHSFNLFPGETKELVVETETQLTQKTSRTTAETRARKEQLTSSFEGELENELQESGKVERSEDRMQEATLETSDKDIDTTVTETETASGFDTGFELGVLDVVKLKSPSWRGKDKDKTTTKTKRENALKKATKSKVTLASNVSVETARKEVARMIEKASTRTSTHNKLKVSAASTEELQRESTHRETVRIENPNVGRTVNYNFFQVQNLYETVVRLTDVKIVLDTGIELVAGTGIRDVHVYELEELGKIYADADQDDPRSAVVAAIVARQVMNHYGDFLPGRRPGNGALELAEGFEPDVAMFEVLHFSDDDLDGEMLAALQDALDYLKGVPFRFAGAELIEPSPVAVNAGAFYLEAEVGSQAATERYLEARRDLETERQRQLVEELRARIAAGVFFPELPEGLTSLSTDGAGALGDRDDAAATGPAAESGSA